MININNKKKIFDFYSDINFVIDGTSLTCLSNYIKQIALNQAEEVLSKEVKKLWLKTFNLKSLEQDFIPTFSSEVKEELESHSIDKIHLKIVNFEKLLERERLDFLLYIKPTLENSDVIMKQ